MKKFLFLGAFALFALTASAQSTEAPAEKKAKTEQTCSKDANKATCSKDKAAGCCSKGASASYRRQGCHLRQRQGCRLLQQGRFCQHRRQGRFMQQRLLLPDAAQPRPLQKRPKKKKKSGKSGNKSHGFLRRQVSLPDAQLDDTEKGKAQPAFLFFMPRGFVAWPVGFHIFAPLGNGSVWSHSSTG